jgi:NMT1-like family
MWRREFITPLGGAALACPFASHAQPPERMRRIGVITKLAIDALCKRQREPGLCCGGFRSLRFPRPPFSRSSMSPIAWSIRYRRAAWSWAPASPGPDTSSRRHRLGDPQHRRRGGKLGSAARPCLKGAGGPHHARVRSARRFGPSRFAGRSVDAPIFVFYKSAERVTRFAQLRGKRLAIGTAGTSIRPLILQVLKAGGAADAPTRFVDLDYDRAIDALIAGEIDVTIFPAQLDTGLLRRALVAPDVRLMNVAQAEAIAKTVPGIKHVVLWQGLVDLTATRDIPDADVNLLASGNSLLVRKDLHPALQYLLLEAIREVHSAPGPFNRLGEFPSEQPNDLPLSLTAQSFYRSGPTFWQRYTSFWLTSLLNRVLFFVVPVIAALIPIIGFASRLYRWLAVRRIVRLHRALGGLERELAQSEDKAHLTQHQARLSEIESAVRTLKIAPPFEVELHRLRIHLRMVQDHIGRMAS